MEVNRKTSEPLPRSKIVIPLFFGLFVISGLLVWFFVNREDDSPSSKVNNEIIAITDTSVELTNGTFSITEDLKTWLNPTNLPVLKGAVLKAKVKDSTIQRVDLLEITEDGAPTEEPLVFDGFGGTFEGKLAVNGDYLTVKNITIKGDLEIGSRVNNSFYLDRVTVQGNTIVLEASQGKSITLASADRDWSFLLAAATEAPTIIFIDSNVQSVTITRDRAILEFKDATTATEIIIASNVTLKTDLDVVIPSVCIGEGVSEVTLEGFVDNLLIDTKAEELTVNGDGTISTITIESGRTVILNTVGNIGKVETNSQETSVLLGENTMIGDLNFPDGLEVDEVIHNYDDVKGNIAKIGGREVEPRTVTHAGTPHIYSQPKSQVIAYGSYFTLSVDAAVRDGILSFQWQRSGDGHTWVNIYGATEVTFSDRGYENGFKYRCVITNRNDLVTGNKTTFVRSDEATITVIGPLEMTIKTQPKKMTYKEGDKLDLKGLVLDVKMDRRVSGVDAVVPLSSFEVMGITTNPANGKVLSLEDDGKPVVISCRGIRGKTVHTSHLIVEPRTEARIPITSIGGISGTAKVGGELTANLLTPANATVTYQWQIASAANGPFTNIEGAITNKYRPVEKDKGKYIRVEVRGIGAYTGTVFSKVTPKIAPPDLIPIKQSGEISGLAQVRCVIWAGSITPRNATVEYQWQIAEGSAGKFVDIPSATSNHYSIQPSDIGKYIRVITQGMGAYTGEATSKAVRVGLGIIEASETDSSASLQNDNRTPANGDTFTITLSNGTVKDTISKNDISFLSNTWISGLDYEVAKGSDTTIIITLTGKALMEVTKDRVVTAVVKPSAVNEYGAVSSGQMDLVIKTNGKPIMFPTILRQPSSQTVFIGNYFSLDVEVLKTIEGVLSYQWQKSWDGGVTWANILGANSDTYREKGFEDRLRYRCIVTNTNELATGNKTATVISAPALVEVLNVVSNMDIVTQPTKLSYFEGEELDLSGLSVKLTYGNGETDIVSFSEFERKGILTTPRNGKVLEKYDSGTPVVISEISGQKAYTNILIVDEVVLESLAIKSPPAKTIYKIGEQLDLRGLVVEGIYNNGRKEELIVSRDNVFGFDSSKPATEQILTVVPVLGKSITFPITIEKADGPSLEGVEAHDRENTLNGMTDAMEFSIDIGETWTKYSEEPSNLPDLTGTLTILVRVAETATHTAGPSEIFRYTIPVLESLTITTPAIKTVYTVGEPLDISGLEITGTYNDGSTKVEGICADNVSGFDSLMPATKQILTVTVGGKSTTYEITIEKANGPSLEGVEANDRENTLIGMTESLEFSTDDGETWIKYEKPSNLPDLTGTITLLVRVGETATHKAGPPERFSFKGPVDVTEIIITSTGNLDNVSFGGTLQMNVTIIPGNATNKNVVWSIENGTGAAAIDQKGLLTAKKVGTVTVKATAQDGTNIVGTKEITVIPVTVNIAEIEGILKPETGKVPVSKINETDQFTGTVTWSPADNPFAAEMVYTATITLIAKEGFTLSGVVESFFTVNEATTASNNVDSGVITAVFPATLGVQEFDGGTGTEDDPWRITEPQHLDNIRNYLGEEHKDKHFMLVDNIDLSSFASDYDDSQGWEPIGDRWSRFMGKFTGNGFTISNLFINRPYTDYVGLFGYCRDAVIRDVHLANIDITGRSYVGSVVGQTSGTISSAEATGTVTGTGSYVGGLAGYVEDYESEVIDTFSNCTVIGEDDTGGLIGRSEATVVCSIATGNVSGRSELSDYIGGLIGSSDGPIRFSYASGDVTGMDDIGGLVGNNEDSVENCHALGNVSGEERTGGLVGYNNGNISQSYASGTVLGGQDESDTMVGGLVGSNEGLIKQSFASSNVTGVSNVGGLVGTHGRGTIEDSYATGSVEGEAYIGGLVGLSSNIITRSYANGSVSGNEHIGGLVGSSLAETSSCYWDMLTTGQEALANENGIGKTTGEMKLKETYIDWNFESIWDINSTKNNGYPYLRWHN